MCFSRVKCSNYEGNEILRLTNDYLPYTIAKNNVTVYVLHCIHCRRLIAISYTQDYSVVISISYLLFASM